MNHTNEAGELRWQSTNDMVDELLAQAPMLVTHGELEEYRKQADALVEAERAATYQNPWDFVQPCEPDCTPERHAYHQGQWNMAQRMSGSEFPTDQAPLKQEPEGEE